LLSSICYLLLPFVYVLIKKKPIILLLNKKEIIIFAAPNRYKIRGKKTIFTINKSMNPQFINVMESYSLYINELYSYDYDFTFHSANNFPVKSNFKIPAEKFSAVAVKFSAIAAKFSAIAVKFSAIAAKFSAIAAKFSAIAVKFSAIAVKFSATYFNIELNKNF
jgi:hypothetical protein